MSYTMQQFAELDFPLHPCTSPQEQIRKGDCNCKAGNSDDYYDSLSELIEQHPIGRPRTTE